MSVTSLVAYSAFAKQIVLRSHQNPLRKIYREAFHGKSLTAVLQVSYPKLNGTSLHSGLSEFCRAVLKRIVQLPITKRLRKSTLLQKKSVILLSAGSFLGYHKDGKVHNVHITKNTCLR